MLVIAEVIVKSLDIGFYDLNHSFFPEGWHYEHLIHIDVVFESAVLDPSLQLFPSQMRVNAMTEQFEDVTVLGHPMIFTCLRVDRDTVPEGLYVYEVRHDDDQQGDPVQIGNWIMVNHWGTIISNKPIRLEPSPNRNNAYRDIDPEEDWNYEGTVTTVKEYMEKHPPALHKEKEQEPVR